jgi:hypothetical protein
VQALMTGVSGIKVILEKEKKETTVKLTGKDESVPCANKVTAQLWPFSLQSV